MIDYSHLSLWFDQLPADRAASVRWPATPTVDVAIVGGGLTGLWTAYYLQPLDPSLRIALLESRGRRLRRVRTQRRVVLGALPGEHRRRSPTRPAATPRSRSTRRCATPSPRSLRVAAREAHRRRHRARRHDRAGPLARRSWTRAPRGGRRGATGTASTLELLDADAARARLNATDVLGATYTPHCAAVQPAKLVRGPGRRRRAPRRARSTSRPAATRIEPGVVRTDARHGPRRARRPRHRGLHRRGCPGCAARSRRSTR